MAKDPSHTEGPSGGEQELPQSGFDKGLDRAAKIAGILLPVTVAIIGGIYTTQKDTNDRLTRDAQSKRDEYQRTWDNKQKQYANLTALIPLLTSKDPLSVATGLDIYTSEARAGQAPTDLVPTIERIEIDQPRQAPAAKAAVEAAKAQMSRACEHEPEGLYIHVANSAEQLTRGQELAKWMADSGVVPVQGAQRVDSSPTHTQLRFYSTPSNKAEANKIITKLQERGFVDIEPRDLTTQYLKPGCTSPRIYELWIGAASPLPTR